MTVHGTLLTLLLSAAAAVLCWVAVDTETDPRRLLGWAAGVLTAATGVTWMLHL
jgi:hypothetical protein